MIKTRLAIAGLFLSLAAQADQLAPAQQQITATAEAGRQSQGAVERLDDETMRLLGEFRQLRAETDQLALYNRQMTTIVNSQEEELVSIARQIVEIERTERGILPLMSRMLDSLEQFVEFDAPFLAQERGTRVELLKDLLTRADVTTSEKFRRVLEAYQIEVDYGRNIEVYRAQQDGVSYNFLRVGRLALYRLTNDNEKAWLWHPRKQWLELDSGYLRDLRKALKVADQTTAPELLVLPLPTPASLQGAAS